MSEIGEAPKRPLSAYFLWLVEWRPKIAAELGNPKGSHVTKVASGRWNGLTVAEKKPFEERAEQLKAEYIKELDRFKAAGGVVTRKQRRRPGAHDGEDERPPKKIRDANLPKKPTGGAYGIYLDRHRAEIMASLPPGAKKFTETAKTCGERWRAMADADKTEYEELYQKKLSVYFKEMEAYRLGKAQQLEQMMYEE